MKKIVFAVETSCDETSISIVEADDKALRVLAHIVESQNESHAPFGGVVPEIAARDHLAKIYDLAKAALAQAQIQASDIHEVAVTMGPGLIGALMVGVLFARGFAASLGVPLRAVNHVDAHLVPAMVMTSFSPAQDLGVWKEVVWPSFPAISLTVSGGHCHLAYLKSPTEKNILGKSQDDACGEAFDKVAKMLGLPYPGGPFIESLAKEAQRKGVSPDVYRFPTSIADKNNRFQFSYSGIKTAVLEVIRKETGIQKGKITGASLPQETKEAIALAFECAALAQLRDRVCHALEEFKEVRTLLIAGGVAQNKRFRDLFQASSFDNISSVLFAPPALCSDNATMIALGALFLQNQDGFREHPYARYEH